MLEAVREIAQASPDRAVLVVLPELVEARWYHAFLHSHTGSMLARRLRAEGGRQVVIVRTPWHLRDWLPERRWLLQFRPLARHAPPHSQRRA